MCVAGWPWGEFESEEGLGSMSEIFVLRLILVQGDVCKSCNLFYKTFSFEGRSALGFFRSENRAGTETRYYFVPRTTLIGHRELWFGG